MCNQLQQRNVTTCCSAVQTAIAINPSKHSQQNKPGCDAQQLSFSSLNSKCMYLQSQTRCVLLLPCKHASRLYPDCMVCCCGTLFSWQCVIALAEQCVSDMIDTQNTQNVCCLCHGQRRVMVRQACLARSNKLHCCCQLAIWQMVIHSRAPSLMSGKAKHILCCL